MQKKQHKVIVERPTLADVVRMPGGISDDEDESTDTDFATVKTGTVNHMHTLNVFLTSYLYTRQEWRA